MTSASITTPLNINKLVEVVGYMLKTYDNRLNYTKLLKLLYLADRQSYSDVGSSITGDSYTALPYGPILSDTYSLICNKKKKHASKDMECSFFRRP